MPIGNEKEEKTTGWQVDGDCEISGECDRSLISDKIREHADSEEARGMGLTDGNMSEVE